MNRNQAIAFRKKIESAAELQSDEQALDSIELYPSWEVGISVKANKRYKYNNKLYRVIQPHVTQIGWTPDITSALFAEVSIEEWPEWKQPIGSSDAYNIGDKVTYNGEHYISTIDNNVWSPIEYPAGWEKQE